jgi:integrase
VARWLTGEAALLKSRDNLAGKVGAIEAAITGQPLARIVEVAEAIKADGIRGKLKPATINRRLAILRRVANLAHDQWGWLDRPLGRRIKLLPGEARRDVFLAPAQVRALADACQHPRVADAIRLAAMTGLREGELLRLTPDMVRGGCIVLPSDTKSGKPRTVPLMQEAAAIALPLGITYATLRTYWQRARAAVGMPGVRFHDLRHAFASIYLASGGSLKDLQLLLGHSTIAITADLYAHLEADFLRAGMRRMAAAWAGQKRGRSGRNPV